MILCVAATIINRIEPSQARKLKLYLQDECTVQTIVVEAIRKANLGANFVCIKVEINDEDIGELLEVAAQDQVEDKGKYVIHVQPAGLLKDDSFWTYENVDNEKKEMVIAQFQGSLAENFSRFVTQKDALKRVEEMVVDLKDEFIKDLVKYKPHLPHPDYLMKHVFKCFFTPGHLHFKFNLKVIASPLGFLGNSRFCANANLQTVYNSDFVEKTLEYGDLCGYYKILGFFVTWDDLFNTENGYVDAEGNVEMKVNFWFKKRMDAVALSLLSLYVILSVKTASKKKATSNTFGRRMHIDSLRHLRRSGKSIIMFWIHSLACSKNSQPANSFILFMLTFFVGSVVTKRSGVQCSVWIPHVIVSRWQAIARTRPGQKCRFMAVDIGASGVNQVDSGLYTSLLLRGYLESAEVAFLLLTAGRDKPCTYSSLLMWIWPLDYMIKLFTETRQDRNALQHCPLSVSATAF
uniref:Uncharacterized protein n=1 Tax=Ditylenchus dipsaci TaxID=166011 RepID=A0A915E5X4_9BILA